MVRVLAFCLVRNIKDSNQNSVYFALGLSHSLAFSLLSGGDGSLPNHNLGVAGARVEGRNQG